MYQDFIITVLLDLQFLYLEFVGVGSSRLTHEDPRPIVELHGVRGTLKPHHHLLRVTAVVEGHLVLEDRQREAAPGVHHAGDVEGGRLVRSLRVGLGVEELHHLAAGLHGAELDANVHELLGPVDDGEEDGGGGSGWLDVEKDGEVAVEWVGDVGQSRLARHRRGGEGIGGLPSRPVDPGDLTRWRVSYQLEQGDTTLLCKRKKTRWGQTFKREIWQSKLHKTEKQSWKLFSTTFLQNKNAKTP